MDDLRRLALKLHLSSWLSLALVVAAVIASFRLQAEGTSPDVAVGALMLATLAASVRASTWPRILTLLAWGIWAVAVASAVALEHWVPAGLLAGLGFRPFQPDAELELDLVDSQWEHFGWLLWWRCGREFGP